MRSIMSGQAELKHVNDAVTEWELRNYTEDQANCTTFVLISTASIIRWGLRIQNHRKHKNLFYHLCSAFITIAQ